MDKHEKQNQQMLVFSTGIPKRRSSLWTIVDTSLEGFWVSRAKLIVPLHDLTDFWLQYKTFGGKIVGFYHESCLSSFSRSLYSSHQACDNDYLRDDMQHQQQQQHQQSAPQQKQKEIDDATLVPESRQRSQRSTRTFSRNNSDTTNNNYGLRVRPLFLTREIKKCMNRLF